jgi:Secretion system C-terminal sorting domain
MRLKRIIFCGLLLLLVLKVTGQKIVFSYDANGNRIGRVLDTTRLKSAKIKFPITDPNQLQAADNSNMSKLQEKSFENADSKINVIIYPNPTKGLIKVEINNMPSDASTELKVYEMSGSEVIVQRNFDYLSEVDLNRLKDGIYILRIKINDKVFSWKVVKNNY